MKYFIVLAPFVLCPVVTAVAQNDTLRQKADTVINNPVIPGLQSPNLRDRMEFNEGNAAVVLPAEVPPFLAKTLQLEEYRGWETGRLFRHLSTGEYKLEMVDDPYVRVFYFDRNGERIIH